MYKGLWRGLRFMLRILNLEYSLRVKVQIVKVFTLSDNQNLKPLHEKIS